MVQHIPPQHLTSIYSRFNNSMWEILLVLINLAKRALGIWDSPTLSQQQSCTPASKGVLTWFSAANFGKQEVDRGSGYITCWNTAPSAPPMNPHRSDGDVLQLPGWDVVTDIQHTFQRQPSPLSLHSDWNLEGCISTGSTSSKYKPSVTRSERYCLIKQGSHTTFARWRQQAESMHTWNTSMRCAIDEIRLRLSSFTKKKVLSRYVPQQINGLRLFPTDFIIILTSALISWRISPSKSSLDRSTVFCKVRLAKQFSVICANPSGEQQ